MCTSCAQKLVEHCKEEKSSSSISSADIDAISNSIEKIFISNDDNVDSDDNDELFKDPPPKEDCQICFLPMPNAQRDVICGAQPMYQPCCGKVICYGCMATSIEEMNEGNMKRWCPFCRIPIYKTEKEFMERVGKRVKLNDAYAFYELAANYFTGTSCLPQDRSKSHELWNQAADLGYPQAHFNLAREYGEGNHDEEKAIQHYKLAAIGGHELARHNLGVEEYKSGNIARANKHFMISARSGYDKSLKEVGEGYKAGQVTKDDYAKTLRAYQVSIDEMKSEGRTAVEASLNRDFEQYKLRLRSM